MSDGKSAARKFRLLNQRQRWEVADELRTANLHSANARQSLVVPTRSFYVRHGKRWLDVAISAVALVVTLPINAVVFAASAATVGPPVIFRQRRLGKDGKEFTMLKPRTMRDEFDEEGRPLPGEQRLTQVGRLIRKTSMDELLNFWSILKGDMSVIGPRPLVPEYADRYSKRHAQRMAVRPGLNFPPHDAEASVEDYQGQFENDVWYVSHVSLTNDLKALLGTVSEMLNRRKSSIRAASGRGSFMGYGADGRVITSPNVPEWAVDRVLARHGLLPVGDGMVR